MAAGDQDLDEKKDALSFMFNILVLYDTYLGSNNGFPCKLVMSAG